MNRFDQLVEDLLSGALSLNQIQMAVRDYVRRSPGVPKATKDVLCGGGVTSSGLIYKMFKPIMESIGAMELVWRRGVDEGKTMRRKGGD